jgi:precorrin-2 methylase
MMMEDPASDESQSIADELVPNIARSEKERREFKEFLEAEAKPVEEMESFRKLAERVLEHLEECRRSGIY